MIVLKGRVLDGNGGAPTEKGAVVLEDNRIRLVCRQSELPDDPTAEVYELEDGTIMPGLIDAHVHMGWGSATAVDWISMTPQLSMARALRDMAQLRQQGYTAFRDLGSDVLLMRPAVAEGLLDVPRIFGAGRIISQIGGHGDVYQKLSLEASQQAYSPAFIVNGVDEVRQALADADGYNAVLIDVKSPLGNFYYSTDIADTQTADADIAACDALIKELTETPDLIVIARVPTFSDPNFVAKHYSSALTTKSGDLWMDERRCYWLRPDSLDARSYLAAIALELDARGFDEVLFDNFTVPDDSSIAWDTEAITQIAALEDCAETLGANLTGSSIRLALGTTVPSVAQYASRVYITTEKANDVMTVTEDMAEVLPDPSTQLVFITTSHDTRFDASGVIRPLLGGDGGD